MSIKPYVCTVACLEDRVMAIMWKMVLGLSFRHSFFSSDSHCCRAVQFTKLCLPQQNAHRRDLLIAWKRSG